jgi:hypothetical protein
VLQLLLLLLLVGEDLSAFFHLLSKGFVNFLSVAVTSDAGNDAHVAGKDPEGLQKRLPSAVDGDPALFLPIDTLFHLLSFNRACLFLATLGATHLILEKIHKHRNCQLYEQLPWIQYWS